MRAAIHEFALPRISSHNEDCLLCWFVALEGRGSWITQPIIQAERRLGYGEQ